MPDDLMPAAKSEIVVYQPDKTIRLEVNVSDETIWLTQQKIGELFSVGKAAISKHLKNIFETGELSEELVVSKMETTTQHGAIKGKVQHHHVNFYNLDAIIAIGYRVNSIRATQFRIWATQVLKRYILNGVAVSDRRYAALAGEMDRRLSSHDRRIVELEEKVDYFVQSSLPPKEKVLCDGQMLDAQFELTRIVKTAKRRIVLVDNYIDERTLMLLGNRRDKVDCTVYTMRPNSPKLTPALANYAREYPALPITVKGYKKSHDRFLIIDNTVWHIGASLKDAGSALFALMKMELDPAVILALLP